MRVTTRKQVKDVAPNVHITNIHDTYPSNNFQTVM